MFTVRKRFQSETSVFKFFGVVWALTRYSGTLIYLTNLYTGVSRTVVQQNRTRNFRHGRVRKGVMGNDGSWSLIVALGVSATCPDIEGNSTNKCIYAFSFLVV